MNGLGKCIGTSLALVMSAMVGAGGTPLAAQSNSQQKTECETAAPTTAPTEAAKGPNSGTQNMGSTGWSGGGMGGSHNDTTSAGPTPGSKTEHPATAQGLNPIKPSAPTTQRDSGTRTPC